MIPKQANIQDTMLRGIYPILITPFDEHGEIDEASLRRVIRFELEEHPQGIGVGGFASEAYKLTDDERLRCAEIAADEVAGRVPLIIGIAPGSTEAALRQAERYAPLRPAALMTLPPATMKLDETALVDHYVDFAGATPAPVMVQQSPHIAGFAHTGLSAARLAEIHHRAPNARYFKIEGAGSAGRIGELHALVGETARLFGGVGGIALQDELNAGAAGLLPGVGFNEVFHRVWAAWERNDQVAARTTLHEAQPLVDAVSGRGHEFSLHARKHMLWRAGVIATPYVRRPTISRDATALAQLDALLERLDLRVSRMIRARA